MLVHKMTFEDFNGDEVTETHHFNLTKAELIELQVSVDGGLDQLLTQIVESKDQKSLLREFKRILLASYGQRSEDGRRFAKDPEWTKEFEQTAAYDALMVQLSTDSAFAADFIIGMMPKDFEKFVKEAEATNQLPPPSDNQPQSTPSI